MSTNSKLKVSLSSDHSYNLSKQNFLAKNKSNISNIDRTFKNNKISKNSVFYDIENNMVILIK